MILLSMMKYLFSLLVVRVTQVIVVIQGNQDILGYQVILVIQVIQVIPDIAEYLVIQVIPDLV